MNSLKTTIAEVEGKSGDGDGDGLGLGDGVGEVVG